MTCCHAQKNTKKEICAGARTAVVLFAQGWPCLLHAAGGENNMFLGLMIRHVVSMYATIATREQGSLLGGRAWWPFASDETDCLIVVFKKKTATVALIASL